MDTKDNADTLPPEVKQICKTAMEQHEYDLQVSDEIEKLLRTHEFDELPAEEQEDKLEKLALAYYYRGIWPTHKKFVGSERFLKESNQLWHELLERQPFCDNEEKNARRRRLLADVCRAFVKLYIEFDIAEMIWQAEIYTLEALLYYGDREKYLRGKVCSEFASYAVMRKDCERAEKFYRMAVGYFQESEGADTPEVRRLIAEQFMGIASMYKMTIQNGKALEYYRSALHTLLDISGLSDIDYWKALGDCAYETAGILRWLGNDDEAERYYKQAIGAYYTACERFDDPQIVYDCIANARNDLAGLYDKKGCSEDGLRTDSDTVAREVFRMKKKNSNVE